MIGPFGQFGWVQVGVNFFIILRKLYNLFFASYIPKLTIISQFKFKPCFHKPEQHSNFLKSNNSNQKIKSHIQKTIQSLIMQSIMQSSSPAFLKCYQCKKSPKQLTFLLCNHIICEKCISKKIEFGHKYNSVVCACGSLTYFNEDSEVVQEEIVDQGRKNGDNSKRVQFLNNLDFDNDNHERERKSTRDPRTSFSNNLSNKYPKQYSKILINQRSTMPMLEVSQVFSLQKHDFSLDQCKHQSLSPKKRKYHEGSFLMTDMHSNLAGTDKTNKQDESLLLESYQGYYCGREREMGRGIDEFSTLEVGRNKEKQGGKERKKEKRRDIKLIGPKNLLDDDVKTIKQIILVESMQNDKNKRANGIVTNTKQTIFPQSKTTNTALIPTSTPDAPTTHHTQFQSQLSFLRIMFQKDTEQIQYQFKKVIQNIQKVYNQLQEELRALYVEQVMTKESLVSLNMADLVKTRYDRIVGDRFRWLKKKLFLEFYSQKDSVKSSQHDLKTIMHRLNAHKATSTFLKTPNSPNLNLSLTQPSLLHNSSNNNQQSPSQDTIPTTNNLRSKFVPQFDTVEQKLQRMTAKTYKQKGNNLDNIKLDNDEVSKRIQTQNVHTSIKRNYSHEVLNRHLQKRDDVRKQLKFIDNSKTNFNNLSPQHRLTEKPTYELQSVCQPMHHHHHQQQAIYYSPPIPYCNRHLQKRHKQARQYISYIEKLCHQKKMKNSHELFKKVKTGSAFAGVRAKDSQKEGQRQVK